MESLDMEPCFVDDLLNFSSDVDEEEEDKPRRALASSPLEPSGLLGPGGDSVRPFHDLVEEDLEWISNKDAFPAVESFMGILSADPSAAISKHHSPVSVLDGGGGGGGGTISSNCNSNSNSNSSNSNSNSITSLTSCFSSLKAPRRVRSKRRCRRRRGDITGRQLCWSQASNIHNKSGNGNVKAKKATRTTVMMMTTIGRKCQHCGADKTPQWRAGPCGPKTLCNACGVRYKSGRLVPEYRPVSSPTFSSELHSNSHRKILEMRRVKQMVGMVVKQPLESR